jgi:hypothetical protein
VASVVDEHAVVEARFLRFELHENVGQIVGALGHRVERRLDGIGGGHDAQAVPVPPVWVGETGEDHHEEAGLGACRGGQAEAPRSRGDPVADGAVALAAGRGGAGDDRAHLLARAGQGQPGEPGGANEAVEMGLEVVDLPVHDGRGVEDAVAAMHDVIVEGEHHEGGVGHDAAELARVESPVANGLPRPQGAKVLDDLVGLEHARGERDHQANTSTPRPTASVSMSS